MHVVSVARSQKGLRREGGAAVEGRKIATKRKGDRGNREGKGNLYVNKIWKLFGKDECRSSLKGALCDRWYSWDCGECWDLVFHRLLL